MILNAIGGIEIMVIGAVVLLIFGGKKLPELMKGMGKGVKSFKQGLAEPSEEEMNRLVNEEVKRRTEEKIKAEESVSEIESAEIAE